MTVAAARVYDERPLESLARAAHDDPSVGPGPRRRLREVAELLADVLPKLEAALLVATEGPRPLDEATRNLVGAGGKRVRPLTALLVANACGGDTTRALPLAAAAELVHSATLLHDDVIDEGEVRRGRPASRVRFGNLVSVLAGDWLLVRALELVQESGVPGAMPDLLGTLRALVGGEVAQMEARGRDDLGVEGYLRIVEGKTASLFAFACRAGARSASARAPVVEAAGRFGSHVGIAFQIVDDVLDLEGDPERVGKRLGADLGEGKTTLPLALALMEDAARLAALLPAARAGDAEAARQVARLPSVREGCARARAYAAERSAAARRELEALPAGPARELLGGVVVELVDRRA
jgi:octaprenyl-diphosphate synthase